MPSQPWLHPDVEVRGSRSTDRGLFATGPLDAGLVVVRLGGRLVGTEELRELMARAAVETYVDTVTIEEDQHLVLPAGTPVHYGNHCCDPTMWHVDRYDIALRRPVGPGGELTIDYATQTGLADWTMSARAPPRCVVGVVTGEDWRRPELQDRYAGHWLPALAARIAAEQVTDPR